MPPTQASRDGGVVSTRRQAAPRDRGPWIERPLWQVGLAAALVAAAASGIVYVAARATGVPMELTEVFEDQSARMPVTNMAWAALLEGVLAGTALAAACRPWTGRPRSCFVALAVAGLIASFALPITSDASTATKVVLAISHVVVAIIVPALAPALPSGISRHDRLPGNARNGAPSSPS
jgi:Kef-type K+ transport system membrane component KefB